MNTFIYISEYEQIIIFVLLIFLFLFGLKKKKENLLLDGFRIDKSFSGALKGIACILILMSHYEQMMHPRIPGTPNTISFIIANTAANVALVWFMFISGYGLTVSKNNLIGTRAHLKGILTRCSKVFFPMLFVFVGSLLLFVVLPNEISLAEHAIPQEFYMLKSQLPFDYGVILFAPIKWYWYVWCILCYYVFFYFSHYLSTKYKWSLTFIMLIWLIAYYIVAYNMLGPSFAHYYRLTWAFFFGHLFAVWKTISYAVKIGGAFWGSRHSISKGYI